MTMRVGDHEYRTLLRRLTQLEWLQYPSYEERQEAAALNARLTEAELQGRGLRAIVEDYDAAIGQAGDLGGAELI